MVDFTVAIPTFNGELRLPEVLDKLKCQIVSNDLSWEVIVVDNNSTDNTEQIVRNYQAGWSHPFPLRYCFEPRQGTAFARQHAVEAAQGKLVGFLDDDNLPASNWVSAAYTFGVTHPQAGAYGSRIQGAFEVKPPENFEKIACFLAIVERGTDAHCYEPRNKVLPPGAGLVVQKQVWYDSVPKQLVLNHRGKAAGLASEDLEALLHIQLAGWEIWHNPAMMVHHKIPSWRLEKHYLLSLVRCIGRSRHHLRMLRFRVWQRPFALLIYMLSDGYKLIQYWVQHQSAIQSDLIAACQMELLVNSLFSPFFLWSKQYLTVKKD